MTERRPRVSASDAAIALLLVVLGVGLPLLVAVTSGSLDIPHNDDWAYRRVLDTLATTGRFRMTGWESQTLIGEISWAWIFRLVAGSGAWIPGISTAVLACVAVLATYTLSRRYLSQGSATLATAVLVLSPGFAMNTNTFMADVPGLAASMVCLLLGQEALERRGTQRGVWLFAALAVGWFAFTIREFAIAAPLAVLISAGLHDRKHWARHALVGVAFAMACGLFYLWYLGLPGRGHLHSRVSLSINDLVWLIRLYFTGAFALSPAIVASSLRFGAGLDRRWVAGGTVFGAVLAAIPVAIGLRHHTPIFWLTGNLLTQVGATGNEVLAGARPVLFDGHVWFAINAWAIVSGAVGLGVVAGILRRMAGRPREWFAFAIAALRLPISLMATFFIVEAGGLGLFTGLTGQAFDRYVWPLAAPAAILLLQAWPGVEPAGIRQLDDSLGWRRLVRIVSVSASLGFLLVVSGVLLLNSDSWDAARWRAASTSVSELGLTPRMVNGGLEWVGFHSGQEANTYGEGSRGSTWWMGMFSDVTECVIVSDSPLSVPGFGLVGLTRYSELLITGTHYLYTYQATPACPASG